MHIPDDETQVLESQESSVTSYEETLQVVVGLIASVERRWLGYEEDKVYSIHWHQISNMMVKVAESDICFISKHLLTCTK